MSAKHTPGPWEWFGDNLLCGGRSQEEDVLKASDDGKPYGMHSAQIEHHWDYSQALANRRLIAAAPELLSALQDIAAEHDGADWLEKAHAAIAKATGGAT